MPPLGRQFEVLTHTTDSGTQNRDHPRKAIVENQWKSLSERCLSLLGLLNAMQLACLAGDDFDPV